MQNVHLTLDDYGMGQKRRSDHCYNVMSKAKVRILAYYGAFDGLFNHDEKRQAKLFGALPDKYAVHHIIPLSCENTNYFLSNLLVIDETSHKWLHKHIYTPQLALCKPHQSCSIWLPEFNLNEVLTIEKLQPFINDWNEYQQRYRNNQGLQRE